MNESVRPIIPNSAHQNGGYSSPLLDGLNEPQRTAVQYRGKALLIVAGAGSGKTRVLTHRIAGFIESREAWPSQILAITFTNKAAAEMRERVEGLLGDVADGMWISTFHSACVRILRREAENFGFTSSFTIYDSQDTRVLLKRIIKQLGADTFGLTPGGVSGKISKLKNELADVDSYARQANFNDPSESIETVLTRRRQLSTTFIASFTEGADSPTQQSGQLYRLMLEAEQAALQDISSRGIYSSHVIEQAQAVIDTDVARSGGGAIS